MNYAIIDCNYFLTRYCFSPNLDSDTQPFDSFMEKVFEFRTLGKIIAVWDGGRPKFRTELYPDYKKKPPRHKDREKEQREKERIYNLLKLNSSLVTEAFNLLGIPVLKYPGYEADDVIYRLSDHLVGFGNVTAVTSDSDYFQMCRNGVDVYRPFHGETIDRLSFYEKFDFDVDFYPLWLSITGTHNSVAGVRGVGPVGATKAVKALDKPSVVELKKWAKEEKTPMAMKLLEDFKIIKRNLILVDMENVPITNFDVVKHYESALENSNYSQTKFIQFVSRNKLSSKNIRWTTYLGK